MFANLKCLGLQTLVPLFFLNMCVTILGTKILRSSQKTFFLMMTKLLNLELRSSLKNVFKKLFRSLHSAGTLKKNNIPSKYLHQSLSPSSTVHLHFPPNPDLLSMSWLSFHGCPAVAVLWWLSCPIQSSPVQSSPVQSSPVQSNPVLPCSVCPLQPV